MDKILIVDDEQAILHAIYRTLHSGYELFLSQNGPAALEILKRENITVILADQRMPEMTGVEFFKRAREIRPDAVRILITGYSDIEATIEAINEGEIFYYLTKPWEPETLLFTIQRAVERHQLVQENQRLLAELKEANRKLLTEKTVLQTEMEKSYTFDQIIGQSAAMKKLFRLVRKVIPTDTTVMLYGETGTGKELVARAIHYNGPRRKELFVAQNCAAIPETLLESELFGYVKGAFTGAARDKKGMFEIAENGTVFLDEIGDTSPAFQMKLLRVLQEKEILPLGAEKPRKINVRIISATNKNLKILVKRGMFREDLFYRLNVFPVFIPPLRERKEDIPALVNHFIIKFSAKMGKKPPSLKADALRWLMRADFPGNVRQLENIIERAVALVDEGETISEELLRVDELISPQSAAADSLQPEGGVSLKEKTEELEKLYIEQALRRMKGNITHTAGTLGLSRLGLHKKLKRYRIDPRNYKLS